MVRQIVHCNNTMAESTELFSLPNIYTVVLILKISINYIISNFLQCLPLEMLFNLRTDLIYFYTNLVCSLL